MVIETSTAMLEPFIESDDWQEPERLAAALPEVMQFDLELMPESLRPMVRDVAERMQVTLDFPAIAAIATLAGITNRRAIMQPKRNDPGWKVVSEPMGRNRRLAGNAEVARNFPYHAACTGDRVRVAQDT